jgi:hypothetical protein
MVITARDIPVHSNVSQTAVVVLESQLIFDTKFG